MVKIVRSDLMINDCCLFKVVKSAAATAPSLDTTRFGSYGCVE